MGGGMSAMIADATTGEKKIIRNNPSAQFMLPSFVFVKPASVL